ncbi:MAG: hypothetical protein U9O94_07070 [Nanoarchaeota archaeon]|nr:hypothetical protein [Nanoarchaeota archaeon]
MLYLDLNKQKRTLVQNEFTIPVDSEEAKAFFTTKQPNQELVIDLENKTTYFEEYELQPDGTRYSKYLDTKVNGIYIPDTVEIANDEAIATIAKFTSKTEAHIQAKVNQYNEANGTKFANVHNCESYSRLDTYTHKAFCLQVWLWSVQIWEAVRAYQDTMTVAPTDAEFQAVLDGVMF